MLLDNRISLCEKAGQLAAGAKKMTDDALHAAVMVVARADGVEMPLMVRLDLAERRGLQLGKAIAEALDPASLEKQVGIFVEFLLPCQEHVAKMDDLLRPTFSNLMTSWGKRQLAQSEQCELKDELELSEKHEEEWQAS